MTFQKTVNDIKSLKIQGAENVAKEATAALGFVIHNMSKKQPEIIIKELKKAKDALFNTRPTEPCMRNAINYVLFEIEKHSASNSELIQHIKKRILEVQKFFNNSEEKIIEYGSRKIKDGMIVYTHCHSSTVTKIIISSHKKGNHLSVHNTETRPRLQGRLTATELAKEGISVSHYVDSAARIAIQKSDVMLIGADAITSNGKVINKIGSAMFAEVANKLKIPVYICTNSWKFDPETLSGSGEKIEIREAKEVWENPPRNVKIQNYAFEEINPELITGVITELGIYKPTELLKVLQKNYKWMF